MTEASVTLSADQVAYLDTQRLGRLATVNPRVAPQNSPVGFRYNAELGTIDIGGRNLGASKKFRNLATNDRVAFVVDDLASVQPWVVRCVEIRGRAEALTGVAPWAPGMSPELIRIHPERVIAFGLESVQGG
ncbi:pyridoxamine 5'-phosphate oxidase family protein [Rhodococcus tukisamuensis]|uniref:Pyridoxamine 5'-phosphate oxidase family protein n=1 Tax=Rhodococcus tukisamuensis TaxID=168276 RepID=A0A1G7E1R4_9NOCA|nr:PPOX class F420-dependent oxidoreductase [Rhodococcus tukisamuensis]SDE57601.1 pyridoxamine 5'-phosphate oxidase family protein [Rhodococcus tukisamuensis]